MSSRTYTGNKKLLDYTENIRKISEIRELYLDEEEAKRKSVGTARYKSWTLSARQQCDLELLLNGTYFPLVGYVCRPDWTRILTSRRLESGVRWPIPVVLDVGETFSASVGLGDSIALRNVEGVMLATMTIEDIWRPDKGKEALSLYNTTEDSHPGVKLLFEEVGEIYLGGRIEGFNKPRYFDFVEKRLAPVEFEKEYTQLMHDGLAVAFLREIPSQSQLKAIVNEANEHCNSLLIIQSVVPSTNFNDAHFLRARCIGEMLDGGRWPVKLKHIIFNENNRFLEDREVELRAIVAKNYGANYLLVDDEKKIGMDSVQSGPDTPSAYRVFVDDIFREYGLRIVYSVRKGEVDQSPSPIIGLESSGSLEKQLIDRVRSNEPVPAWMADKFTVKEIRKHYSSRSEMGLVILFTGLSGAGKSTIAIALATKILEKGQRKVSILDGDVVRSHLSSELGFSKEHRDLNVRRIGFVASEIARHGGIAICAPIAPYRHSRRAVRAMASQNGGFIEIHVSTPLTICEQRDAKGLYIKARSGLIKSFTGISDPYELPEKPELRIDTSLCTPEEAVQIIMDYFALQGYCI